MEVFAKGPYHGTLAKFIISGQNQANSTLYYLDYFMISTKSTSSKVLGLVFLSFFWPSARRGWKNGEFVVD